ncbi:DUF975 family protein [Treponema sp.]|uniref:DUF975 family protein n=1 Tax=Treponema sp. TaxID=166 RepID=UPI003F00D241
MSISRSELKTLAKEQIKGNVWTFFGLLLIFGIIQSVSSFTFVGPFLLQGPLQLGLTLFMIEVVRTKKGQFNTGFKGFNQFGTSFVATLLMSILIFLWSLLLIIPGIIACFRYALTYYIIADNPEMSGSEAVKKSKEMMKGHKWELFVLLFSFFWWYLLCVITLGLAAIYVLPYINATMINYYEKLKEETANSIEE